MRLLGQKISPFFISVVAAVTVTVAAIIFSVSCSSNKITFKSTFYFVCYAIEDNAVSAGSVSQAVSSYGGAGYILEYNGAFYVTVSCYYKESDAQTVCNGLKRRELECEVLKVETKDYPLRNFSTKSSAELYRGNLTTLQTLTTLAYDCANKLDTGEYGQNEAKTALKGIENGLKGLLNSNADNCFSQPLRRLISDCGEISEGYIYSKDLRKLQIAAADVIINVQLY